MVFTVDVLELDDANQPTGNVLATFAVDVRSKNRSITKAGKLWKLNPLFGTKCLLWVW